RADLERVCEQRGWEVVQVSEVEESAYGKKPREQFQVMLEDARRGKFDVLLVWSLDRFSRQGGCVNFRISRNHDTVKRYFFPR
ncbi:MAG: recombinase family protein, partial [Chloroflexi bacterium]|nr:recombinase family protein [Chloroflexota bacterium]